MDGIKINDVSLCLIQIPGRKGLAFTFQDGNAVIPVAYVSAKNQERATVLWGKLLNNLPAKKM